MYFILLHSPTAVQYPQVCMPILSAHLLSGMFPAQPLGVKPSIASEALAGSGAYSLLYNCSCVAHIESVLKLYAADGSLLNVLYCRLSECGKMGGIHVEVQGPSVNAL